MTIEEQLKAMILSEYKSLLSFSTKNGIPNTTLDNIFRRGIRNSGFNTIIKIFDALDIDTESVKTGNLKKCERTVEAKTNKATPPREEEMLNVFHQLNEIGQDKVVNYARDLVDTGKYSKSSANKLA